MKTRQETFASEYTKPPVKTTVSYASRQTATEKADLAGRSTLYREFAAEREEILRHKWIESEKIGRDIGFERALVDWIKNHREKWRQGRRHA